MSISPSPAEIRQARHAAALTQAQAAALVHVDGRSWRKWEGAERTMHPAFWELFQLKTRPQKSPVKTGLQGAEQPPEA